MTVTLTKPVKEGQRAQLEAEARRHAMVAKEAAERGDVDAAARSILALLDCERRQASQGPQVMQVIKPRSASRGLVS